MSGGLVGCLTEALQRHVWDENRLACSCGEGDTGQWDYTQDEWAAHAVGVVLGELTQARTVTTREQLAALPGGAVIKDYFGHVLQHDGDGLWLEPGAADLRPTLPACLLWVPSWGEQQ